MYRFPFLDVMGEVLDDCSLFTKQSRVVATATVDRWLTVVLSVHFTFANTHEEDVF